jgi:ATP-binding cassette, subfamily C, bacterial
MSAATSDAGHAMSAPPPASRLSPTSAAAAAPRLRDAGVTPLFIATAVALTLGAQLGPLSFVILLMHITDGMAVARNPDTLVGFALVFLLLIVLSTAYHHLRSALLNAAAARFGLRLQAMALQAAIRNAVRTDPGGGLAVVQDINRVRGFLGGGGLVAGLDLFSALVALSMLFVLDTRLGLMVSCGVLLACLLGFAMHRATARPVAEARERMLDTAAELGGQLVHPDLSRGIGLLPATMLRWRDRYEAALRCFDRSQARVQALLGLELMLSELLELAVKVFACWLVFYEGGTTGLVMGAYLFCGTAMRAFSNLFRSWES